MRSACLVFATLLSDDTPPSVALIRDQEDGIGGPSPTWVGLVVCSRSEVRASVATAALQTGAPTNTTFYSRTPQNPDCHKSRDSSQRRSTRQCPSKTSSEPQTGEKDLESLWIVTRAALSTRRPLDRPAVSEWGHPKRSFKPSLFRSLELGLYLKSFLILKICDWQNFQWYFLFESQEGSTHTCLSRSCLAECEHEHHLLWPLRTVKFSRPISIHFGVGSPWWLILVDTGWWWRWTSCGRHSRVWGTLVAHTIPYTPIHSQ